MTGWMYYSKMIKMLLSKEILFFAAGLSTVIPSSIACEEDVNIQWEAYIEDGGVQTQEHIAKQLEAYLREHRDVGVAQDILNIFQAQTTDPGATADFHPDLPDGCEITDRYTRTICFGSKVTHVMMVEVRYRGFFFLLQYMVLSNGQMNYSVVPQVFLPS